MVKDKVIEKHVCQLCGKEKLASRMVSAMVLRTKTSEEIKRACPTWTDESYICHKDLYSFLTNHIKVVVEREKGELSNLEDEIIKSFKEHELLSKNIQKKFESELSFGQRLADKMASFGGSWKFLIIFSCILFSWIGLNSITMIIESGFDPFPFILLNLVLSCLAAVQAPVIMMSQNRQEAKDRLRSEHDYQINLKAELEIRQLHEKIDHMITSQWQRLVEIEQIQLDINHLINKKHLTNGE